MPYNWQCRAMVLCVVVRDEANMLIFFPDYAILQCSKLSQIMLDVDSDYAQIILYCLYMCRGLAFVSRFQAMSAFVGYFRVSKNETMSC